MRARDEEILGLEIAMRNVGAVEVLTSERKKRTVSSDANVARREKANIERHGDLRKVEFDGALIEAAAGHNVIGQLTAGNELEDDVVMLLIFVVVDEADDVGLEKREVRGRQSMKSGERSKKSTSARMTHVIHRLEDLYLAPERLGERRLHHNLALFDDFDGAAPAGFAVHGEMHRRERAAAEYLLDVVAVKNAASTALRWAAIVLKDVVLVGALGLDAERHFGEMREHGALIAANALAVNKGAGRAEVLEQRRALAARGIGHAKNAAVFGAHVRQRHAQITFQAAPNHMRLGSQLCGIHQPRISQCPPPDPRPRMTSSAPRFGYSRRIDMSQPHPPLSFESIAAESTESVGSTSDMTTGDDGAPADTSTPPPPPPLKQRRPTGPRATDRRAAAL